MNLSRILNTAYPSNFPITSKSTLTIQTLLNPDDDGIPNERSVKRRRLTEPPSSPISTNSLLGSSRQTQISYPTSHFHVQLDRSPASIHYSVPLSPSQSSSVLPSTFFTQNYPGEGEGQYEGVHEGYAVGEEDQLSISILPNGHLPDSVGRRLSQARLVGLRHRKNEKLRSENLELDITNLQQENDLLKFQIREAKRRNELQLLPEEGPANLFSLSMGSTDILGVDSVNGSSALLFLEFIALRRNMNLDGFLKHTTLEAPKLSCLEAAIYIPRISIRSIHVEMHGRWSYYEANSMLTEEKHQTEKRCTRCSKPRSAGSGHPRSSCDDGFRVASDIPYRPQIPPE